MEPGDSPKFAAKVCAMMTAGTSMSIHEAGRDVLRAHLQQKGLDLKENNDVFYKGKLVARIGAVSYDGKTLDYTMQPVRPLHHINVTTAIPKEGG